MKKNEIVLSLLFIGLIFLVGCKKMADDKIKSSGKDETNINTEVQEMSEVPSNEGTYTYEDSSASLEITVSGSMWSGKTVLKSGFGDAYDTENTEYQSGIVKGSDLYDDSGYVKIGYVDGNTLTTSMGGNRVTLSK